MTGGWVAIVKRKDASTFRRNLDPFARKIDFATNARPTVAEVQEQRCIRYRAWLGSSFAASVAMDGDSRRARQVPDDRDSVGLEGPHIDIVLPPQGIQSIFEHFIACHLQDCTPFKVKQTGGTLACFPAIGRDCLEF